MMKILSHLRIRVLAAASGRVSAEARFIGNRLRSGLGIGDQGQALVEAAIVLPLMLMLLVGMFSVGVAMIQYEMLGEATFAGSQQFQNGRGILTDPCASAATAVTAALPNWVAANITYSATITDNTGTAQTIPASTGSFSCISGSNYLTQYEPATFTVSYPYTWIPIYGMKLGTGALTRSQTVLVE
jgi:Flp pilus assembly protein TadG